MMLSETYKPAGPLAHETVSFVFDSVEELLTEVAKVPESRIEFGIDRQGFVGRKFTTWAAVYEAARSVWSKGLETVERMLDDIDGVDLPRPTSRRRRMRFSEDNGDEVDYDRLRSGQPFWRSSHRQNTRGPATITILVDVGANARTKHTDILWRGAAAIALTKRLEEAGYRVELWACHRSRGLWATGGKNIDGFHAYCLKRPGDVVDPSTLVSAVSGWFFRTVIFRASCMTDFHIDPCLGRADTPRPEDLDRVTPDQNRVLIAGAFSYADAVSAVRNVLTSLST